MCQDESPIQRMIGPESNRLSQKERQKSIPVPCLIERKLKAKQKVIGERWPYRQTQRITARSRQPPSC